MTREVEVKDGLVRLKDSKHWYKISFFFQVNVLIEDEIKDHANLIKEG
jgi:hypothetical protein